MRHLVLLHVLFAWSTAWPQATTLSVQDGDWDDPATWDCGCVPEVHNAEVLHQVRIAGNTFFMQRVHVAPLGRLYMDQYFSVAIMDTVINNGLMELVGDIDVDWALINNSVIHIQGVIHNDAVLVMGGPNALLATDDIGNYGIIEGEGRICVSGFSENTGAIHGLIDFCDGTPMAGSPPFIDVNTGTVGGSVTFCAGAPCGPQGMQPIHVASPRISPNPASGLVRIELSRRALISVRDASGRPVLAPVAMAAGANWIDVSGLHAGAYAVHTDTLGMPHRLVVAR